MSKKPQQLKIGDTLYWNDGSDLDECEECGEPAFSHNENGSLLCAQCLAEWHDIPINQICEECGDKYYDCECR